MSSTNSSSNSSSDKRIGEQSVFKTDSSGSSITTGAEDIRVCGTAPRGSDSAVGTGSSRGASEVDGEADGNQFNARDTAAAALLHPQLEVALLRGAAAGVLTAAATSAFFFVRSSRVNILKTRTFWTYNGASFSCGFLGGWIHTKAKLRARERRLAELREATIPNMNFMSMESLAPPLPADSYTAAGEEAAARLLQGEQQQRNSKKRGV